MKIKKIWPNDKQRVKKGDAYCAESRSAPSGTIFMKLLIKVTYFTSIS